MSQTIARFKLTIILILCGCLWGLTGCNSSPNLARAQDRAYLPLQIEYLDEFILPQQEFENTTVGGLSGIVYDRGRDRLLAISDDRSRLAPARYYTLNLDLDQTDTGSIKIQDITVKGVTYLHNEQGVNYPSDTIDAEGITLTPRNTLFISSEGVASTNIPPSLSEYTLEGAMQENIALPTAVFPNLDFTQGIQENRAFEALTTSPHGLASDDPFRLFTATELALIQDQTEQVSEPSRIRLLHYSFNSVSRPLLLAENLYLLEPNSDTTMINGLTELVALDTEGFLLSLERTFGLTGFGAKIFQVATGNATDVSAIESLRGDLSEIRPLKKKLLLDLDELDIKLDNLEGMTLGPQLADGSRSLILVSDNNFKPEPEQVTQFLLFRLGDK